MKTQDVYEEVKKYNSFNIHFSVDKTQLYLNTVIFSEKDYIPPKVRSYVEDYLSVEGFKMFCDEDNFQIILENNIIIEDSFTFKIFLKKFDCKAKELHEILKEIAKQDLIHINH